MTETLSGYEPDYHALSKMMDRRPPGDEWAEALEAFITADKAREKAQQALAKANAALREREADLRVIFERLTGDMEAPA